MRILKYELPLTDEFTIPMPSSCKVLSVGVQNGIPVIWAQVNDWAETKPKKFRLIGTGHQISGELGRFIGTFQVDAFVGHLFEARS